MTTKRYYEQLPRTLTLKCQCQVLNNDGNRCPNVAVAEVDAHLDNEMYTNGVGWVAFNVCQEHLDMEYLFGKP